MQSKLRVSSAVLAVTLSLVSLPLLTACSPQEIAEKAVEQAVKDQTGVDIDVNGASLPDGWPAEVQVIDGKLSQAVYYDTDGKGNWSVLVEIDDIKADFDEAKAKIEAAGFKSTFNSSTEQGSTAMLSNGTYTVTLVSADDGSMKQLAYAVNEN